MTFESPLFLLLIVDFFLLLGAFRYLYPEKAFSFPTDEVIASMKGTFRTWGSRKLVYLRIAAIVLIGVALARPQLPGDDRSQREGIAIMIAVDCSSTMLAEDLQLGSLGLASLVEESSEAPRMNRLEAVKGLGREFIEARKSDMIGVVAFAAQAYVICPPTFDREWALDALKRVRIGLIKDGTAIGSGILSSLDALKGVRAKSKIVVLLTDGINNFGEVPPLVAAKAARALGIKIYPIAIISKGQTPFPAKDAYGKKTYKNVHIDVDETVLQKIAEITGGVYYRATDMSSLKTSYADIDKLEKIVLEESAASDRQDIFSVPVFIALALLIAEIVLGKTIFRKIP
jgi:Ca-activated chloride channel family protein